MLNLLGTLPVAPAYSAGWAESDPCEALIEGLAGWLERKPLERRAPGDVLVFRFRAELPAKHAAILTGEALMTHAHAGACVAEVALTRWWLRRLAAVFSFPETGRL